MSVANRINILIEELGENRNSFSNKIGVTPSTIATAISRDRGVSSDLLQKIIDAFTNVNINWLLTGKGDMFISSMRDINTISGSHNIQNTGTIGGTVSIGTSEIAKELEKEIENLKNQLSLKEAIINEKDQFIKMLLEKRG